MTILHELSHWKVRRTAERTSPIKSFKWSYSAESGHWLEGQLFGGTFRVRTTLENLRNDWLVFEVPKSTGGHKLYIVGPEFGERLLGERKAGQLTLARFNKLREQHVSVPKTTPLSRKEVACICQLSMDRLPEEENKKGGKLLSEEKQQHNRCEAIAASTKKRCTKNAIPNKRYCHAHEKSNKRKLSNEESEESEESQGGKKQKRLMLSAGQYDCKFAGL
eukprot:TRINITY_DN226_c0_g1_i4.p1 TRINITY_DN226_c0_g1~~TRINITY_DN226_c0_g1_i4.p1  ORF type:complete len:220 (-),score=19.80 TRINITY_DN226_c0_g1_i4:243-902(-)